MGILRADVVSHSQLEPTGSVFFDVEDKITTTGFGNIGTSDFTLECWVYLSTTSGTQRIISANEGSQSTEYTQIRATATGGWQGYIGTDSGWWEAKSGNDHPTFTTGWHHVVLQRFGNDGYIFVDGQYVITSQDGSSAVNAADPVTITTFVLGHGYGSEYLNSGYISNARVSMRAVYGGTNFTPPKFELKSSQDTYLLCCQSSSSPSEAAVVPIAGLTVTGAAASSLTPDLKKDITDTGVVVDGFGNFATSTYMVPPKGSTAERNRGRMILFGGGSPGRTDNIDSLELITLGNAIDFGSLSAAVFGGGATASSTRGVFWLGEASYTTLEFVTISNSSNTTTFGTGTSNNGGYGFGNQTRGIWALGTNNALEFVTIATTGNTSDFGDQTLVSGNPINEPVAFASPTRGVIAGGYGNNPYPQSDVIEYVTIATTGNTTDFGDLTQARSSSNGLSNSTRGIIAGGYTFPGTTTYYNIIEFVTIATTGNATDFGDAVELKRASYNGSSPTRGVFAAGTPATSATNSIEFITIATTGNASDFGDTRNPQRSGSGCSDSHGGLS